MITAVLVHPDWGTDSDIEVAARDLLGGNEYEVENIVMGQSSTSVYLKDFDVPFNSIQFDILEDGNLIDIYHDERFNPYLRITKNDRESG